MKKFLFLTFLFTAANTFCLNQKDQDVKTPLAHVLNQHEERRQRKYDQRVENLLKALVQARSKEDLSTLSNAYHDLSQACENNQECKVTDKKSLEVLKRFNLVDSEGVTTSPACKTIERLKNNSTSLRILH